MKKPVQLTLSGVEVEGFVPSRLKIEEEMEWSRIRQYHNYLKNLAGHGSGDGEKEFGSVTLPRYKDLERKLK